MLMVGTEWLVDAAGCRAKALHDVDVLREVFTRIIANLNLQPLGEALWHQFPPPGGVTGLLMLSESHLACHTYPEFGVATFNLYCCRARPAWAWDEQLTELLGATSVMVRVVERPLLATPQPQLKLTSLDDSLAHDSLHVARANALGGGER